MIHKTKGIVLRSVKFGETSVVVTLITELFGLQTYMVNGVRTVSKKGSVKAAYFQPAAILEMEAYHNELKNIQRIKEYKWAYLYQHIFSDVRKNAVAVFIIELLTKCLKQPEGNAQLFYFVEDALCHLDTASDKVAANFPLFFALHLAPFFGFGITDESLEANVFLDLLEGQFVAQKPNHPHYLEPTEAAAMAQILKTRQPLELEDLQLNREARRKLTTAMQEFYSLHISDFGTLKTLPVLREIMS